MLYKQARHNFMNQHRIRPRASVPIKILDFILLAVLDRREISITVFRSGASTAAATAQ